MYVNDSLFIHHGTDNSLVVWNMDSCTELGRLVGHDAQVTILSAAGNMAVSAQVNGPPRVWNLEAMLHTATLPELIMTVGSACCVEGKVLLGSALDGLIKLWDVTASAPIALPDLAGHTGAVHDVKASSNTVLSGSVDKTVRLWDLRSGGKCVRTMVGHTSTVLSVDMDGNCRAAVSGSKDTTVKLWDLGSGRCCATFEGHPYDAVQDVVMHKSGSSFLSSGHVCFTVNAWAVGSSKASMRADLNALSPGGDNNCSRLFASRDLSTVAYCCLTAGRSKLELRVWR